MNRIININIGEKDPETGQFQDLTRIAEGLASLGVPQSAMILTFDSPPDSEDGQVALREYDFDTEGSLGYVGYDTLKDHFRAEDPNANFGNHTRIWKKLADINEEREGTIIYERKIDPSTGRVKPAPLERHFHFVKERGDLFVSVDALYRLVDEEGVGGPKANPILMSYINQRIERHRKLCPR